MLEPRLKWKTSRQGHVLITDMDNGYLFNTACMIWNNKMPAGSQIRYGYKKYSFGPAYTEQYMAMCLINMLCQLVTRWDTLNKYQKKSLYKMYIMGKDSRYIMTSQVGIYLKKIKDLSELSLDIMPLQG